jgi:ferric-dicitrate binding protein FerR (iron transport regulator)
VLLIYRKGTKMRNFIKNRDIVRLIARALTGTATQEESESVNEWLNENPENRLLFERLKSREALLKRKKILREYDSSSEWKRFEKRIKGNQTETERITPTLIHTLSKSYIRYAAAAILVLAIAGTGYLLFRQEKISNPEKEPAIHKIVPGGTKAILILSNGSQIVLDSAKKGTIATQAGTDVVKESDGQLAYANVEPGGETPAEMNSVLTPRGGEYAVVLPDGSVAKLNAASSIKFPVHFNGKERRVEITGEVYFEVEKSKVPFMVSVNGRAEVKVLGTHFNVNAYEDEMTIMTTLVEGSVQVTPTGLQSNEGEPVPVILAPGWQSELSAGGTQTVKEVNTALYTAWTENRFLFRETPLEEIMKSMARWYDFDVIYRDQELKSICFTGNIPRDTPVEEVFTLLGKTRRIIFKVEQKTITIMKEA